MPLTPFPCFYTHSHIFHLLVCLGLERKWYVTDTWAVECWRCMTEIKLNLLIVMPYTYLISWGWEISMTRCTLSTGDVNMDFRKNLPLKEKTKPKNYSGHCIVSCFFWIFSLKNKESWHWQLLVSGVWACHAKDGSPKNPTAFNTKHSQCIITK